MTTNVTLWPQTLPSLPTPTWTADSPPPSADWLDQAAGEAETRSAALADADAGSLEEACAFGARPVRASDAEIAALREAFAPVYADSAGKRRPSRSSTRSRR